ncbi:MAG TPA: hypothetical protein VKV30_13270, partial [Candidatus Angelobacter sp.]|nr:hypothetical protein [Candidatus Angelobacter sp.]
LHVCSWGKTVAETRIDWRSAKAFENAYNDLSLGSRLDKVFFSTYIHSAAPIFGIALCHNGR